MEKLAYLIGVRCGLEKLGLLLRDPDSPEGQKALQKWDKQWAQLGVPAADFLASEPGLTEKHQRIFSEALQRWPGLRIHTRHIPVDTPHGPGRQRHYQMIQA